MPLFSIPISALTAGVVVMSIVANNPANLSTAGYESYRAVGAAIAAGVLPAPSQLNPGEINPPPATNSVQLTANLDAGAAVGDSPPPTPVTVYDSLGSAHVLSFNFTKIADSVWKCTITIPKADLAPPHAWVAATPYAAGQNIIPNARNGHIYQCTVAGPSGETPPNWPTDGSTITDGGVTWQDMGTQTTIDATALTFDDQGNLTSPTGNIRDITVIGLVDGASNLNFTWTLFNSANQPLLTQEASASVTFNARRDASEAAH